MASTIMHMVITELAAKAVSIQNTERLLLGAVLPDAYTDGVPKKKSHLDRYICGNAKKTYDLTGFRKHFEAEMKTDNLYLGYYLHLIQDLIYRDFVYREHHWNPCIPGNVERLHHDYSLLNDYIIKKYYVQNTINIPENFATEQIHKLYPFDTKKLLSNLQVQFMPGTEGEIFFFTKEMADQFIKKAVNICIKELQSFFSGKKYVDEYTWAWNKKVSSLLKTTQNTRDLGGYKTQNGTYTNEYSLIRSDYIKYPSERDLDFLMEHQICTIIDMREEKSALSAPSPFKKKKSFQYYHIPIMEGSTIPESISDVPYSYMRIAESVNIPEVFRCISKADTGVLFHCSAGKDRTGVVSAILLLLAGVNRNDIVENYMITKECNRERFKVIPQKFPNLDINIVIPHEEYIHTFLDLFLAKYHHAENYLQSIGLKQKEVIGIKNKLLNS